VEAAGSGGSVWTGAGALWCTHWQCACEAVPKSRRPSRFTWVRLGLESGPGLGLGLGLGFRLEAEQVDQQTEAGHDHQQVRLLGKRRVGEAAVGLGKDAGGGVEAEV
jgi:hypothetical protein